MRSILETVRDAIREADFEAVVVFGELVELRLSGSSSLGVATSLQGLIDRIHVANDASRDVVVDIASLEFMNAGCFNVFVNWLARIGELAPEQRYRLRFLSNANIRWQHRSLRTLSCFATELVVIGEAR
jgi:hypothetical protein